MNKDDVILIVEDDAGHAGLIRINLERSGIRNKKVFFKDGAEILDFLCKEKENLFKTGKSYILLLDIRLPKIDGVEVLRHIKGDKELSIIPVIMFTTSSDPYSAQVCRKLGCLEYFVKPVNYEEFLNVIKRIGELMRGGLSNSIAALPDYIPPDE
ncbi:MAG: response regulator [Nitrospirae bacterium]|nr:response regulator [Nitrospirota bacterium]